MQTRRTPLPPLQHRRSSLLSLNSAASPHTPRSSGCFDPCPPPICYAQHRKSTDSWNSSNADDMDFDWKPEQILLLTRTLDALPAHLVTPFHGSIPPSNLLDKIARGVANAKGPVDWPHSIRATRVKLLELARARAKEEALAEKRRHIIQEEDAVEIEDGSASNYSYTHGGADKPLRTVGMGPRRPLYRQSSMDFIKPGAADLKDNPNIAKLSNRLQRNDRTFPNPAFHPYARTPRGKTAADQNRRSESPPHSSDVPGLMSPSTPSSTTLNSISSLSSAPLTLGKGLAMGLRPRALRRSASTLSSSSLFSSSASSTGGVAHDPRLQRVRRSDSFSAGLPPPPPPKDFAGLKRAPSYGALAQDARAKAGVKPVSPETTPVRERERHVRQLSAGAYPSSDEEEKARTRRAKKMRTRAGVDEAASPPSSAPPSPSVAGSPMVSPRVVRAAKEREGVLASPKARCVGKSFLYGMSMVVDGVEVRDKEKEKGEVKEKEKSKTGTSAHRAGLSKDLGKEKDKDNHKGAERDMHTTVTATPASAAARTKDKDHTAPSRTTPRAPRMSLQRNPSMFGAELPPVPAPVPSVGNGATRVRQPLAARAPLIVQNFTVPSSAHARAPAGASASAVTAAGSATAGGGVAAGATARSPTAPASPDVASPRMKTLRRVRRLPGARRISFGSLVEEDGGATSGVGGVSGGIAGGLLEEGFGGGGGGFTGGVSGGTKKAKEGRERGLGSAFQMS